MRVPPKWMIYSGQIRLRYGQTWMTGMDEAIFAAAKFTSSAMAKLDPSGQIPVLVLAAGCGGIQELQVTGGIHGGMVVELVDLRYGQFTSTEIHRASKQHFLLLSLL